ncbi:hypothetical protein F4604DRAFT_1118364 [Suillus subluteus]|nr:hypothetical protein F4604DRAFT_1118364 [Suillus subluteus]
MISTNGTSQHKPTLRAEGVAGDAGFLAQPSWRDVNMIINLNCTAFVPSPSATNLSWDGTIKKLSLLQALVTRCHLLEDSESISLIKLWINGYTEFGSPVTSLTVTFLTAKNNVANSSPKSRFSQRSIRETLLFNVVLWTASQLVSCHTRWYQRNYIVLSNGETRTRV